jgi:hypothetical protein
VSGKTPLEGPSLDRRGSFKRRQQSGAVVNRVMPIVASDICLDTSGDNLFQLGILAGFLT